ncbi:hypothetical protein DIURU_000212 [Diutina rugosa]|uniref:25S rRNA (uridine-N(3))-methyltransferase BMT5-like domain-containing protein n=1 Tax=Diutina rugosa TaxID=5481 RepID=A0A642V5S6_DIURU|nr:uncharacterized protein DIURU_000212 [Diutina rugosa]KAA8908423.1 hypothetical protein DIURU_000212 [Diutina rugosa]
MAKGKGKGLKGALARHVAQERMMKKQAAKVVPEKGKKTKPQRVQASQAPTCPWHQDDQVLLVGEGDFSFALSVVKQGFVVPTNLVATSYDSYEDVVAKYAGAEATVAELISSGVKVLHNIDATKLSQSLQIKKKPLDVNVVVFNFPHTGKGIKDQARNIRDHQILVSEYFKSARELLTAAPESSGYFVKNWRIMLSLFDGEPYDSWQSKRLARDLGLQVDRSVKFGWSLYPGYHHRRTNSMRDTTKPAEERSARTYVFVPREPKDDKNDQKD